ncbi:YciI family protein [Luteimicrobium sp. NPDC057192]|uniref:YciI family protein n=1 Tax=Luteimicrobium sp. NPDC057192 TaxID=3346042 RepID=UPI00364390F4
MTDEAADDAPPVLYVLRHRPGPAVPSGTSVSDHPGIGEHYAFLRRRAQDGTLVAAGPLEPASGEGMTVLAVPTRDEAERLAAVDDRSVSTGVLAVEVREWHVVLDPGLSSRAARR